MSGFDGKHKVNSLFNVSRFSIKIQLSNQGLLIVMEKPIKNTCLSTMKHVGHRLFDSE